MSDPVWPITLPQRPIFGGWRETPQPNVVRFQPAVGAPKQRRRSTANSTLASALFDLLNSQEDDFWTFYRDDCKDGSLPFQWTHPKLGGTYRWAFESEPQMEAVKYNQNNLTLQLRRLP
jgi:hypothetical protein